MTEKDKINWVYNHLEDEESKMIFENRVKFNESDDYRYIGEIVDKYVPELAENKWNPEKERELVREILSRKKKTIIFGAGYNGKKVFRLCTENGVETDFFCDNNKERQNTVSDEGIPIIALEDVLKKDLMQDHVIVVSPLTEQYYKEIYEELMAAGIDEKNVFLYKDYLFFHTLEDRQYFDPVIELKDNEVFVDGGCYAFDTSKILLSNLQKKGYKCKKIFAFEPDKNNYLKCKAEAQKVIDCDVDVVNAGLWSMEDTLSFKAWGTPSSRLTNYENLTNESVSIRRDDQNIDSIQVVSLDYYVKENVSFIKLEVEGSELEALRGDKYYKKI